jgi:hypothetical protein
MTKHSNKSQQNTAEKRKDLDYIDKLKAALRTLKEIDMKDFFKEDEQKSVKINSKKLENQKMMEVDDGKARSGNH